MYVLRILIIGREGNMQTPDDFCRGRKGLHRDPDLIGRRVKEPGPQM